MDLGAIFFLLAVLILVGMYLYAPFVSRVRRVDAQEQHELSSLMAERDRILNALQELDFDHKLGKIPAEDYPAQRAELLQKGADILRKLDSHSSLPSPREAPPKGAGISRSIPTRDAPVAVRAGLTDDDIESMVAARRRQLNERSAGFCPRCGQAVLVNDRFCPACGKALT